MVFPQRQGFSDFSQREANLALPDKASRATSSLDRANRPLCVGALEARARR